MATMHGTVASYELRVEGMTCPKCVGRVERALLKVPGVESATVVLDLGRASVYGGCMAKSIAALDDAGYPSTPWVAGSEGCASLGEAFHEAQGSAGWCSQGKPGKETSEPGCLQGKQQSFELSVEGMTCLKCVGRVEKALLKIPGVESATASLPGSAHVTAAPGASITVEALCMALDGAGYPASSDDAGYPSRGDGSVDVERGGEAGQQVEMGSIELAGRQGKTHASLAEEALAKLQGVVMAHAVPQAGRVGLDVFKSDADSALSRAEAALSEVDLEVWGGDAALEELLLVVDGMTCAACVVGCPFLSPSSQPLWPKLSESLRGVALSEASRPSRVYRLCAAVLPLLFRLARGVLSGASCRSWACALR